MRNVLSIRFLRAARPAIMPRGWTTSMGWLVREIANSNAPFLYSLSKPTVFGGQGDLQSLGVGLPSLILDA